jgi:hypothetical protein
MVSKGTDMSLTLARALCFSELPVIYSSPPVDLSHPGGMNGPVMICLERALEYSNSKELYNSIIIYN